MIKSGPNLILLLKAIVIAVCTVKCCHSIYKCVFADNKKKSIQDKRQNGGGDVIDGTNVTRATKSTDTGVDEREEVMKRAIITKPKRMWIDGTCYVLGDYDKSAKRLAPDSRLPDYETEKRYDIYANGKKFYTRFKLPQIYSSKLLDRRYNLNDLEYRTNSTIRIPEFGDIQIRGLIEAEVAKARDEIQSIVGEIRETSKALQFLSIPIRSSQIREQFLLFKNDILKEDDTEDSQESLFINPDKLHLTIAVFSLMDASEKKEAIRVLDKYKREFLSPLVAKTGPLKINVSGISCMQTDLTAAHVVYANAKLQDETEELSLQKIANDLGDFFYEKGLVKGYKENVKLHMTLINTRYRKNVPNSPNKRYPPRQSFDATSLIEKYKDFSFGECLLDEVHLSIMSTIGEDGFYKPLSVVKL